MKFCSIKCIIEKIKMWSINEENLLRMLSMKVCWCVLDGQLVPFSTQDLLQINNKTSPVFKVSKVLGIFTQTYKCVADKHVERWSKAMRKAQVKLPQDNTLSILRRLKLQSIRSQMPAKTKPTRSDCCGTTRWQSRLESLFVRFL